MPVNIPAEKDIAYGKPKVVQEAAPGAIPKSGGVTATLTYVDDGDTAKFSTKKGELNCRIAGIDAPETDHTKYGKRGAQPYSAESKATLERLLSSGQIQVTVTQAASEANYNRSMCKIEVSGKDISRSMLEAGAAMLYEKYNKDPQDKEAQKRAIKAGKGIWGMKEAPVAPWSWRHDAIVQ